MALESDAGLVSQLNHHCWGTEMSDLTRRAFLGTGVGLGGAAAGFPLHADDATAAKPAPSTAAAAYIPRTPTADKPLRLAAINSIYRFRSHAYHIVGRFIHGYRQDGLTRHPPVRVVRMFNDQYPANDLSRRDAPRYGFTLCDTPEQTLGEKGGLDVDGVLLIVEHGDYQRNARGQILYPRYELFEKVVQVFRKAGRVVPVFIDKHFSWDAERAHQMYAWARELGIPLLAGSSLPVTFRLPEVEPPVETPFTEGVATFGYENDVVEIYLFHALETLQVMMERRTGGETGVKRIRCLLGDAVFKAGDEGQFSWELVEAALSRCPTNNVGSIRDNVVKPLGLFIEYRDGTKAAVFNLIEQSFDLAFGGRVRGVKEPVSCCMFLPGPPRARFFDPLSHHIAELMLTGRPNYPVERTLLTTTLCDLAHRSLEQGGTWIESPLLDVRYQPPVSSGFFRGPFTDRI